MKKDVDFHVRISREDLQKIDEQARIRKMSRSKFLIQAALNQKVVMVGNEELRELTVQLRRIGINLNQITTLCNMGKLTSVNLSDVNNEVTKIWESIENLRKDVKNLNKKAIKDTGGKNEYS